MGFKKRRERSPEQELYVGYYPTPAPAVMPAPFTVPVPQTVPIAVPEPVPIAAPVAAPIAPLDQSVLQQIEAAVASACGTFKPPQVTHQVVHVNGGPGQIYNIRRRCPDTQPDTVLKTIVVHQSPDMINLTIEKPMAPPVVTREQIVYDQKPKALLKSSVVAVPHTPSLVCAPVPAPICAMPAPICAPTSTLPYSCGLGSYGSNMGIGMYGAGLGDYSSSSPLQGSSSLYDYGSTYSPNMNYPMNYGYQHNPYF